MSRYVVTTGLNFQYTFDLFYIYFGVYYRVTLRRLREFKEDIECRLKIFSMEKEEKKEW